MTPGVYICPKRCVWSQVGPGSQSRAEATAKRGCPTCNSTGSTLPLATYTDGKGRQHKIAVLAVSEGRVHGLYRNDFGAAFSVDEAEEWVT